MSLEKNENLSDFRKKVYTKMYHSSMSLLKQDQEKPRKRIIPTVKKCGLREEFKRTFLPLLIDIFELRQMIQNRDQGSPLFTTKSAKTPAEIIKHLEMLQNDIEESKRWCEGVILQISKGIEEAKEALQFIENSTEMGEIKQPPPPMKKYAVSSLEKPSQNFFKRLSRFFLRKKESL